MHIDKASSLAAVADAGGTVVGVDWRIPLADGWAQVGPEQAERWGLITEINDDPFARATELAASIVDRSPSAMRAAKRLIEFAEANDQADVLLRESVEQVELIGKPDQMETIAAQMQGRKPNFK